MSNEIDRKVAEAIGIVILPTNAVDYTHQPDVVYRYSDGERLWRFHGKD